MFTKYSSLENHTNDKFLTAVWSLLDEQNLRQATFVAREKIHGTNFSVIISPDTIQSAKRTGLIGELEKFFGYEDLMQKYKDQFRAIQTEFYGQSGQAVSYGGEAISLDGTSIQIFGEYAGGNIQKEVNYGDKDFYVFDILITDINGKSQYLNDRSMASLCSTFGLKVAPLIKYGTLEELLQLPVEFQSNVAEYDEKFAELGPNCSYLNFPQNAPNGNVAEGLVIKPVHPLFMRSGSRVAIKYKTDAFKEKSHGKAPKIIAEMEPVDIELLNKLSEFITPARVKNVLSHLGEITAKEFPKLMGMTMHDLLTEAQREGVTLENAVSPSRVKNELQKLVQVQVRDVWVTLDFSVSK